MKKSYLLLEIVGISFNGELTTLQWPVHSMQSYLDGCFASLSSGAYIHENIKQSAPPEEMLPRASNNLPRSLKDYRHKGLEAQVDFVIRFVSITFGVIKTSRRQLF